MSRRTLSWSLLLLLVLACRTTGADHDAVRAEIETSLALLVHYGETKDSASSARMHTGDALLLPPGGVLVEGRDAVEEFMAVPSTATISDTDIRTLRLDVDGDHAYHVGTYAYTLTDSGVEQRKHGRFVMIWRRTGDGWKVAIDIWDSE